MQKILLLSLSLLLSIGSANATTIHMSGYNNASYLEYCPGSETEMTFFARDIFQNKIHGSLQYFFFVDGISRNDIEIYFDGDSFVPPNTGPYLSLSTDSNKESKFKIRRFMGYDSMGDPIFAEGFGFQSNNIRLEVRFKRNGLFTSWKTKNFFFHTRAIEPGLAVVQGTNSLTFCSSSQVQTVTLPNFPASGTNTSQYCFWHHKWVWELPAGWKIANVGGNISTATNTLLTGAETVLIQSPSGLLPPTATLNVRSEDAWPYPVNTQSTIFSGTPNSLTDISYGFSIGFPVEICYDNSGNIGDFIAETSLFGVAADSYDWESNAGNILSSNTTFPATQVQFTNPGINRFIRVRARNACGVSAWYTKYFDLVNEPFGCSNGGGGIMFSMYPNPAIDIMHVEIDEENFDEDLKNNKTVRTAKYRYDIVDSNQRIVYTVTSSSPKEDLPVKNLAEGIYILRITTNKGSTTKRLLINRSRK